MNRRWQCEDGDGDQSGAGAGDADVQHQTQPTGADSVFVVVFLSLT